MTNTVNDCYYQRKSGRWVGQIDHGRKPNGQLDREYYYGSSRKAVKKQVSKRLKEIYRGQFSRRNNIKLKEWLKTWIKGRENSVAYKTYIGYQSNIDNHLIPDIGEYELNNLTTRIIQNLINDKFKNGKIRGEGGLSFRSVESILQTLNISLEQALKERLINHNPVEAVELPKKSKRKDEMNDLSKSQANKFLRTAKDSKLYIAYLIELNTGLRRGELAALKWSDLDEINKSLKIERQLQRVTGQGVKIKELKTESAYRTIPINDKLIKELMEHRKKQKEFKLLLGPDYNDKDMIISNYNGGFVNPDRIYREFKSILKSANLPIIRFHDLRHTFATLALEAGINMKVLQSILGHASIKTTLDTYAHVNQEMNNDAAEKISGIIR